MERVFLQEANKTEIHVVLWVTVLAIPLIHAPDADNKIQSEPECF